MRQSANTLYPNRSAFSLMFDIAQSELSRVWIPGALEWIAGEIPKLAEAIAAQEQILSDIERSARQKHDEFDDVWEELCIWRDLLMIGMSEYRKAVDGVPTQLAA